MQIGHDDAQFCGAGLGCACPSDSEIACTISLQGDTYIGQISVFVVLDTQTFGGRNHAIQNSDRYVVGNANAVIPAE